MKHVRGVGRGLRGLIVIAVLTASLSTLAVVVAAADPLTAQTAVTKVEPRVGRSNTQAKVTLAVSLKPTDDRALNDFLAQLYNPQSAQYRKFVTPQQFTDRFFAPADRTRITSFLTGKGLTVTDHGVGAIVNASGSVADVERAFNVTFSDYRAADGHLFRAADRTPALPSSVATKITGVTGLDNSFQLKPRAARKAVSTKAATPRALSGRAATGCTDAVNSAQTYGAYAPNQIATAYNFNPFYSVNYLGEGESIALFEQDDFDDANVATYQSCFGTTVDVERVLVDGGAMLGQAGGQNEVELDVDVILGMAPHLSHLYVYSSPNDADSNETETLNQYQQIANDNLASVVSTSWGTCENAPTAFRATANTIFSQMAAEGQTFFDAIGDTGSEECVPDSGGYTGIVADEIGSQPYVTGVGGTTLTLDPVTDAYAGEVVWNNSYGVGGGGISQFWPIPAWQSGPGVINNYSTGKRQSPDVAANADPNTGYLVYTADTSNCPTITGNANAINCFDIIAGTSASAPLWAAATALTNQALTANGLSRLGFANPTIYALFRTQPTLFHDITQGDNCFNEVCVAQGGVPGDGRGIYPATSGYDMTTGVGTLNAFQFALAVVNNHPSITAIDVDAGPTDGGTLVTLTGVGFMQGMTVQFGDASVAYTLISANTLKVVTPPHSSAVVSVTVTTPAGVTATAPHTFAFVDHTPAPHATAPVPTPAGGPGSHLNAPPTATPPPTAAPHAAAATTGPVASEGARVHPDAATVAATPNPAPARH